MKRFALLVLWFVGVGAATAVAWAGVSVVENKIIDPPPAIAVDQPSAATDVSSTLPVPVPSTVETSSGDATTSSAPTTTTSPTASSTSPPLSSSTTSPPLSSSTTATTAASEATSQTFKLIGGTTAISFSPEGATVLWATPEPGFDVRIEPEQPGIKVEFRAEHHRSRVDAWWASGPRHEIDEEPRN